MPGDSSTLSPAQERTLLNALFSSSLPLPDLAASFSLSLLDLLELIASPAFQSKLIALEQAAAHAVRVAASARLPDVFTALAEVLAGHRAELRRLDARTDEPAINHRRDERINLRRAATLLLRLSRFTPVSPTAKPPPGRVEAPRREAGSVPWSSSDAPAIAVPDSARAPQPIDPPATLTSVPSPTPTIAQLPTRAPSTPASFPRPAASIPTPTHVPAHPPSPTPVHPAPRSHHNQFEPIDRDSHPTSDRSQNRCGDPHPTSQVTSRSPRPPPTSNSPRAQPRPLTV